MEDNKPNQADPSVQAAPADSKSEAAIQERVASAVTSQKERDNIVQPVKEADKKPEGGKDSDVTSPKSSSTDTDPNAEVLKFYEATFGRKFDSVEEAQKHGKNLNGLVGEQSLAKVRESAKLYESLVGKFADEKSITVDEAKKFWADTLTAEAAKPVSQSQPKPAVEDKRVNDLDAQIQELKGENQKFSLLNKYPYAAEVQEEIAIVARQKGISQLQAFESSPFKALLEQKAKEESAKSPVVTPSNRTSFDSKKVQELGSRVMSHGRDEDKQAFVSEVLGDLIK